MKAQVNFDALGGGGNLTYVTEVANIRNSAYTFPSTGKFVVITGYSVTNNTKTSFSDYSISGGTLDTTLSHVYDTTVSGITVTVAVAIIDVTSANATIINSNYATNAQSTVVYKLE